MRFDEVWEPPRKRNGHTLQEGRIRKGRVSRFLKVVSPLLPHVDPIPWAQLS